MIQSHQYHTRSGERLRRHVTVTIYDGEQQVGTLAGLTTEQMILNFLDRPERHAFALNVAYQCVVGMSLGGWNQLLVQLNV